jgi:hypothetical protein
MAAAWLLAAQPAEAQEGLNDPRLACDRAAAKAERDGNLPAGLLAAIGAVESGRVDANGLNRRAWPWSINAEGWSYFAPTRSDAISAVRALQARGVRTIDVGCFQVDLFYHPNAFATLEEAFDPEANARAASRILSQARFGSTGWDQAVALYHSASLLRGAWYLQQVQALWPAARTRLAALDLKGGQPLQYVVLMSPEARLVKVITPGDAVASPQAGLPHVISPGGAPGQTLLGDGTVALPRILTPADMRNLVPRAAAPL